MTESTNCQNLNQTPTSTHCSTASHKVEVQPFGLFVLHRFQLINDSSSLFIKHHDSPELHELELMQLFDSHWFNYPCYIHENTNLSIIQNSILVLISAILNSALVLSCISWIQLLMFLQFWMVLFLSQAHTTGFLAGFCCRGQISTVCDKTPESWPNRCSLQSPKLVKYEQVSNVIRTCLELL